MTVSASPPLASPFTVDIRLQLAGVDPDSDNPLAGLDLAFNVAEAARAAIDRRPRGMLGKVEQIGLVLPAEVHDWAMETPTMPCLPGCTKTHPPTVLGDLREQYPTVEVHRRLDPQRTAAEELAALRAENERHREALVMLLGKPADRPLGHLICDVEFKLDALRAELTAARGRPVTIKAIDTAADRPAVDMLEARGIVKRLWIMRDRILELNNPAERRAAAVSMREAATLIGDLAPGLRAGPTEQRDAEGNIGVTFGIGQAEVDNLRRAEFSERVRGILDGLRQLLRAPQGMRDTIHGAIDLIEKLAALDIGVGDTARFAAENLPPAELGQAFARGQRFDPLELESPVESALAVIYDNEDIAHEVGKIYVYDGAAVIHVVEPSAVRYLQGGGAVELSRDREFAGNPYQPFVDADGNPVSVIAELEALSTWAWSGDNLEGLVARLAKAVMYSHRVLEKAIAGARIDPHAVVDAAEVTAGGVPTWTALRDEVSRLRSEALHRDAVIQKLQGHAWRVGGTDTIVEIGAHTFTLPLGPGTKISRASEGSEDESFMPEAIAACEQLLEAVQRIRVIDGAVGKAIEALTTGDPYSRDTIAEVAQILREVA